MARQEQYLNAGIPRLVQRHPKFWMRFHIRPHFIDAVHLDDEGKNGVVTLVCGMGQLP